MDFFFLVQTEGWVEILLILVVSSGNALHLFSNFTLSCCDGEMQTFHRGKVIFLKVEMS